MKKAMKWFTRVVGAIAVVAAIGIAYLYSMYPDAGPVLSLKVTATPERLARGAYLANHVAVCIDCHSTRDWNHFSGPIVAGTEGKGGERFDQSAGLPGILYAPNITPAALGAYSDGVLYRAIACGVDGKGNAMFPLMPYLNYNALSEGDLHSIIAYLRTLRPIENTTPPAQLDFPINLLVRTLPVKRTLRPEPDTTNVMEYGRYLVQAAGCAECHTTQIDGKPVRGMEYAGGFEFRLPNGSAVRSANITPDEETGIGHWTVSVFVAMFTQYADSSARTMDPAVRGYNTPMPWTMYAGLTERDLTAMYTYLRTLPAIRNDVVRYFSAK